MIKSKDSAEKIVNIMKIGNSSLDTNIKKMFSGVVRFIPDAYEAADVANLFPANEKALQIRKSRTVRLYFMSKE